MPKHHIALFGRVAIPRGYCERCESTAFIIDSKLQCCDAPVEDFKPGHYIRVCEPEYERRRPPAADKRLILSIQDNRCFYCNQMFGAIVVRNNRKVRLKLHWDHLTPFAYQANNSTKNFVAACHVCNMWKGSLIFQTIEEAKTYVAIKWENSRRQSRLSLVWGEVQTDT